MKRISLLSLLLITLSVACFAQTESRFDSISRMIKATEDTSRSGPITVVKHKGWTDIMQNGRVIKTEIDTNAFKRDTSKLTSRFQVLYIVNQQGKKTIQTTHVIYSLNSIIDEKLVPKAEAVKTYHIKGVTIINLKPGVKVLAMAGIYKAYKVPRSEQKLPVYINFREVANPSALIAADGDISRVSVVTDIDKFKFLNIITNEWDQQQQLHKPGDVIIHIR